MPSVHSHRLERRKGGAAGAGRGGGVATLGLLMPGLWGQRWFLRGRGGGLIQAVPERYRFAGRHAGGGWRREVYGNSTFGSGYPYGSNDTGIWVGGRDFPFYFWPAYVGAGEYYGTSELLPTNATDRPGGILSAVSISSNRSNTTSYPTSDVYRILGDFVSVQTTLSALVLHCAVSWSDIFPYDSTSDDLARSLPRVESVVQWYRASSFALALDGYNDTTALPSNPAASNRSLALVISPTPIPLPNYTHQDFLACINSTIGANVPIVNSGLVKTSPTMSIAMLCLLWTTLIMFRRMFL